MMTQTRFHAAALHQDDLVRFNSWILITRLRSIAGLLALAFLSDYVAPHAVPVGVVALIAGGDVLASLGYHW
jgi:hypothetical protein